MNGKTDVRKTVCVAHVVPRKARKRVLVALPFSHISQRKLCGIFRYAGEADDWELHLMPNGVKFTADEFRNLASAGIDGVIAACDVAQSTLAEIAKSGIPVAMIGRAAFPRSVDLATICTDDVAIGREAALFLLRYAHLRTYAYVHALDGGLWDSARMDAYRDTLAKRGVKCAVHAAEADGGSSSGTLESWLQSLPKPVAVFAAEDYRAYDVLNACKASGLRVPQDVVIVGVGNTEAICENAVPSLSTVEPDYDLHGYLAAANLDRIMSAKRPSKAEKVLCGVKRIVARDSTPGAGSRSGMLVQKALAYIRGNVQRGIGVRDVLAHLRVSRTLAANGFRDVLGTTILKAILGARLELTRKALLESSGSIAEVCAGCGWKSENHPKKLFRAKYGESMRDFRRTKKGLAQS